MPRLLLPDQLAATLGRAIVGEELAPGSVLRLEDLESRHEVSRTVARDAVKSLAQLGLVGVRRRVGTVVNPPQDWDDLAPLVIRWRLDGPRRLEQLAHISELRMGCEPVAAHLAARRATPEQVERLVAAAAGMASTARVPDLQAYLAHDVVFHQMVLEGSGNPMFGSLSPVVAEVLSGRTEHHLMPAVPNPVAVRWHQEVAEAVRSGEGELAEQTMRQIVTEAQAAAAEMAAEEQDDPS